MGGAGGGIGRRRRFHGAAEPGHGRRAGSRRRFRSIHIPGYAATAGAIDTLPVAGALAVPVVQGKMLHSLAGILGVTWTRTTLAEVPGCLGAGALLRFGTQFGVRQLAKPCRDTAP